MPTEVKGAIALRKALRNFEPTLAKETNKEIARALRVITTAAKGFVPSVAPLSGWGNQHALWEYRAFNAADIKKGIKYKATPSKPNRKGFRALASIYNASAAGAIYETAGRKSGVTGNFTPRLGGQLVGKGQKMTGRAIFRAFEEDRGKAQDGVVKAIFKAKTKFDSMKDKV